MKLVKNESYFTLCNTLIGKKVAFKSDCTFFPNFYVELYYFKLYFIKLLSKTLQLNFFYFNYINEENKLYILLKPFNYYYYFNYISGANTLIIDLKILVGTLTLAQSSKVIL